MFNLDPAKLLVIAIVAIILLGPDKLPQVAKQAGAAWRTLNEFRHRMESEVRNTMPDLPPTSEIARLARSPTALLTHLSNMSPEEEAEAAAEGRTNGDGTADGSVQATPDGSVNGAEAGAVGPLASGSASASASGGADPGAAAASADGAEVPATAAPSSPSPSPEAIAPGDPTLN